MPTSRLAYRLSAGNRADLIAREEMLAPPAAGEVQIVVHAIGLNFADVFSVWGLYSATPKGAFVPGLEVAGIITEVGEGVASSRIGERVYGVTRFGAYTTALNLDARYALPLPSNWSFAEGAAFPVQALTAYYGLVTLGNVEAGQQALVHSAAGGVGVWAGRICRQLGVRVVGTVGHVDKVAFAKTEGYDEVTVRPRDASTLGRVLATAAKPAAGYNVIMEATGGKVLEESFKLLLPEGRMVVYGSAHFASTAAKPNKVRLLLKYLRRPRLDPQAMIAENKGVLAFNLIWLYEQTEKMLTLLTAVHQLDLGPPHIGHEFMFADLPEAVKTLQGGRTVGKVIVNVSSS